MPNCLNIRCFLCYLSFPFWSVCDFPEDYKNSPNSCIKCVFATCNNLYLAIKRISTFQTGHRGKGGVGAGAASGRLVCDVKISAKELIRCRSYDLTELVSHVLKKKRSEIDVDMIRGYYKSVLVRITSKFEISQVVSF